MGSLHLHTNESVQPKVVTLLPALELLNQFSNRLCPLLCWNWKWTGKCYSFDSVFTNQYKALVCDSCEIGKPLLFLVNSHAQPRTLCFLNCRVASDLVHLQPRISLRAFWYLAAVVSYQHWQPALSSTKHICRVSPLQSLGLTWFQHTALKAVNASLPTRREGGKPAVLPSTIVCLC